MLCAYISVSFMRSKPLCTIIAVENSMHSYLIEQIKLTLFRSTFETPTLLDGYDRIQTPFLATSKLTGKGRVLTAAFPTPPAPAAASSSQP